MQVSHELDLKAFYSWPDEVRSALYGEKKEVRELHALDWKVELLGDPLWWDKKSQPDSQRLRVDSQLEVSVGTEKGIVDSQELDRRQIFEDPQREPAARRTGQEVRLKIELWFSWRKEPALEVGHSHWT